MSEESFVKLVSAALKAGGLREDGSRVETERAIDVLNQLESFQVTSQLLSKTNGGKQVRRLCKSGVGRIAAAAHRVIKEWKAQIVAEQDQLEKQPLAKSHSKLSDSGVPPAKRKSPVQSEVPVTNNSVTDQTSLNRQDLSSSDVKTETSLKRKTSVSSSGIPRTGNQARKIVREKFEQLLENEEQKMRDVGVGAATAAAEIEKAIYTKNGDPAANGYKTKFRSLLFNLKDPKNGSLRQRILRREIHAEELVQLSSEELANDEKKRENDDIRKKALLDCQRGLTQGATTDAFTCGKCKANECTYYQMQTRSADEPMTVYVTCTKCHHRWKC